MRIDTDRRAHQAAIRPDEIQTIRTSSILTAAREDLGQKGAAFSAAVVLVDHKLPLAAQAQPVGVGKPGQRLLAVPQRGKAGAAGLGFRLSRTAEIIQGVDATLHGAQHVPVRRG